VTEGTKDLGRGIGGASRRTVAWLAWSLCAIAVALTTLSLLLLNPKLSQPRAYVYDYWLDSTLNAVFFSTVGAIVASRRSENLVGWLLCLYGLAQSISHFSAQYAIYALLAQPDSLHASLPSPRQCSSGSSCATSKR
jgi:hypothetical protein